MSAPDLSIIIPYYNRADTVEYTLRSIELARRELTLEIILVDDGSPEPFSQHASAWARSCVTRLIRQANQGLLYARSAGLASATGTYTLFLDSDDLVGPDKFTAQINDLRARDADVSYTDVACIKIPPDFTEPRLFAHNRPEAVTDPVDFFLRIQPAPHSPIFRTSYLHHIVAQPVIPLDPLYNPVAEIWFYYNAAANPGRVVKTPGLHTWIGVHPGPRISGQWEKMGFASLALSLAFVAALPRTEATRELRQALAMSSFQAWRSLPYDFCPAFQIHLLDIWRTAPDKRAAARGGRGFKGLARFLGPVAAGRLLRRLRGQPYACCRTLDDQALSALVASLPKKGADASP